MTKLLLVSLVASLALWSVATPAESNIDMYHHSPRPAGTPPPASAQTDAGMVDFIVFSAHIEELLGD